MNSKSARLLLFVGGYTLALLVCQSQGAKYSNTLDLNDNEMTSLLDELSLPQHRIIQDRPKPMPWINLLRPEASEGFRRVQPVYYEYDKPVARARRRRIVVKMKNKHKPVGNVIKV